MEEKDRYMLARRIAYLKDIPLKIEDLVAPRGR
jgi:hypothetical protein